MTATTLAERLNRLIQVARPPGRGPYTGVELVAIAHARGLRLSEAYLCQLRSGYRVNPSRRVIEAMAEIFGVEPTYLTNSDPEYCARVDGELSWLEIGQDDAARRLTPLIMELPDHAQQEVLTFIDGLEDSTKPWAAEVHISKAAKCSHTSVSAIPDGARCDRSGQAASVDSYGKRHVQACSPE